MKEKDTVPIFKSKKKTTIEIEDIKTYEIPKWLDNLIKLGVSISNYLPRK